MGQGFTIDSEPAKALTANEECALVEQALEHNPGSAPLRARLALLLNLLDRFDEAVALLERTAPDKLSFAELLALGRALLAQETVPSTRKARRAAKRALALAQSDAERSAALAELGKAALRLGDRDCAVGLLEDSLRADPANPIAFKRLAGHLLRLRMPDEALELADRLIGVGVRHSRLLSSRMVALAQLGRITEARELLGLARFASQEGLSAPAGWNEPEFNRALAAEMRASPALRYGRYGTASNDSWRIDSPASVAAPAARALVEAIAERCRRHVATLPSDGHPWLEARPRRATLSSWCVITGPRGFEDWHTHSEGWLSGVYYAAVPAAVANGAGEAGCLALGLPEGLAGTEGAAGFGTELVRPRPGLLVMFPSHGYHRTFAHCSIGRRICISFDLRPA